MIELLEDVALFMTRNRSTSHLGESVETKSLEAVRVGVVLSLPVVIANLDHHVEDPVGSYWLTARLAELGPSKAVDYAELTEERDVPTIGDELLGLILGDRREGIVEKLAARSDLSEVASDGVLVATGAGVLVRLADRHVADRRDEIVAGLHDEVARLTNEGWAEWIASVVPERSPAADAGMTTTAPPAPARRSSRLAAAGSSRDLTVDGPDDDWSEGSSTNWRTLALAGGAVVVVALAALWLISALTGDDARTDATGDGEAALTSTPADGDRGTGAADESSAADGDSEGSTSDGTTSDGTTSDGTASADDGTDQSGDLVVIDVPLDDPLGRLDGTGSALLTFDRVSGEVCYEFDVQGVASPYDGHIHVGPAGVKGGIVIDFGELEGRAEGCLDNEPVDTNAILGDVAGHYVEFHDADEINTVRSQLAEADRMEGDVPEPDPEVAAGGAVVLISDGALTLSGDVPDQVTIDKFVESFADIDLGSTELINELEIVSGAPRPSGDIIVDDGVFFALDSAQITGDNSAVLDDLATIVRSRPAWSVTVVGHTDDTGGDVYNLELSLRRAEAVRAALIEAGVPAGALTVKGAGSTEPIADNGTPDGRAENRRIELQVEAG